MSTPPPPPLLGEGTGGDGCAEGSTLGRRGGRRPRRSGGSLPRRRCRRGRRSSLPRSLHHALHPEEGEGIGQEREEWGAEEAGDVGRKPTR